MAFVPWKDRVTATPHRYRLTEVSTDTYDLTAVPGAVSEAGTPVNATNLDRLIQRDGDDIKDTVVAFTEAGARANIATGERTATLFGKVKKYFTDLKAHAFTAPSTTQGTGTDTVPSSKLLKESSFARVIREATEIPGITYPVAIGDLVEAIMDANLVNCYLCIGMNAATETKVTGLPVIGTTPQTFGTLTIITGSTSALRMRIEYNKEVGDGNVRMWIGGINRATTPYTVEWKEIINDSTAQTISGVKTFSVSPLVPTTPSGVSAAVAKSYVDGALANPTILLNGDFFRNDNGIAVYSSAVESCINHFGFGLSGTTGSYNATTRTLKSDTFETPGKYAFLYQYVDNPARLNGKVVTLSAKAVSTTGFFLIQLWKTSGGNTTSIGAAEAGRALSKSVSVNIPSGEFAAGDTLRVIFQTYGETALDYIKLEIGSLATAYTPEQARVSTVYDKVIRTQTEFNALIGSPTWLGATSVAIVGQFTLSTANNRGVKIPATVKQIHGFNGAKITITNFKFDASTGKGGLWYDTTPTTNDYSIRDLEVSCTATYGDGYGFANCINLSNCTGTGTAANGRGFYNCKNLSNCTGTGTGTASYGSGYGFLDCRNLSNCTGTGTGTATNGSGYGFHNSTNLSNCTGSGEGTNGGYGFHSIEYAVNCKGGVSSTNMWGGTNRNIDLDTCRRTPVEVTAAELITLNT